MKAEQWFDLMFEQTGDSFFTTLFGERGSNFIWPMEERIAIIAALMGGNIGIHRTVAVHEP